MQACPKQGAPNKSDKTTTLGKSRTNVYDKLYNPDPALHDLLISLNVNRTTSVCLPYMNSKHYFFPHKHFASSLTLRNFGHTKTEYRKSIPQIITFETK